MYFGPGASYAMLGFSPDDPAWTKWVVGYVVVNLLIWFCVNSINGTWPKFSHTVFAAIVAPFLLAWALASMFRRPSNLERPQPSLEEQQVQAYRRTDPFTPAVAKFHKAFGVRNPDRPEFPTRDDAARKAFREIVSCMREVASVSREASKRYDGKDDMLQRAQLMCEELHELLEAMAREDAPHVVAEASDLVYTITGTLLRLGLGDKLLPVFDEVHASNMSKLDPKTGKPFYDDSGKITKGPYYVKPNLRRAMNETR